MAETNAADALFEEELTRQIIGAAIEVHRSLGPGLLESAYQKCLAHELSLRGLVYSQEVPIPVAYKGISLECGYRADFIIAEKVVVEIKSVETLSPVHEAQLDVFEAHRTEGWPAYQFQCFDS